MDRFSKRIMKPDFQDEFIAAMLKAASDPNLISFGGGLPNPISFPIPEMEQAVQKVLEKNGVQALQYSATQGYGPLREFIAQRYAKAGVEVTAQQIIVTNGSQQALDMFAATLLDPGDELIVENPSYLAALQTFHLYDPNILTVDLTENGMDCEKLAQVLETHDPKFMYVIPNFQNPTGLTYTQEVRTQVAELIRGRNMLLLEDNPYGELRFRGQAGSSFGQLLDRQACLMGTFSKIVTPGMRIGWIACRDSALMQKLITYKSTMDLHTNIFCQMVLAQYLADNDLDAHITKIKDLYRHKADLMMESMAKYFPESVSYTKPEGGMFLWATAPEGVRAIDIQRAAMEAGVLITAGDPFYERERGVRTMRINYSNSTDEAIDTGIKILGDTIRKLLK